MEEKIDQEIKIDAKSKALFVILGLLIVGSVAVTYHKYIIKRDYIIQASTDCDPESEACFVWECDPESMVEGEACTGVPDNDIWYYKLIERKAYNIPNCDPDDEECDALVCAEDELECQEVLCNSENVPEGEACSDPEQYLADNPPDEECAEDDEECLASEELAECEEDNEECLAEQEESGCAPDDEECLAEEEAAECESEDPADCEETDANEANKAVGDDSSDSNANENSAKQEEEEAINIPPPGVEPN